MESGTIGGPGRVILQGLKETIWQEENCAKEPRSLLIHPSAGR